MPELDLLTAVRAESERFRHAARAADLRVRVPSCPDWTLADLVWHLTAVQELWAKVAAGPVLDRATIERIPRPPDDELLDASAEWSDRLVDALASHAPDEPCWSWHHAGGTVGWVLRRQAHEVLIHRVDAELAADLTVTEADPALAGDGVDEALTVMIADVPPDAVFTPDGRHVRVDGGHRHWLLGLGRLEGTAPRTGEPWVDDAAAVVDDGPSPDATITGSAWDLDRWLWGRGELADLHVDGDRGLADRLRLIAIVTTQ